MEYESNSFRFTVAYDQGYISENFFFGETPIKRFPDIHTY